MGRRTDKSTVTAAVWGTYFKTAMLWLIPALLALPIYLIVLAICVLASDGSLLEATEGVRGGINAALGPLLISCGVAAAVVTALYGAGLEDHVAGGFFAIISFGLGAVLMNRELRRMATAAQA